MLHCKHGKPQDGKVFGIGSDSEAFFEIYEHNAWPKVKVKDELDHLK
jgi:hypothetical protein